jgi:hypothetical protein
MGVISLDQAEPSMVLANPVTDKTGRLLIPAGKVLSERHLESLRMWGISTVDVEGSSPELSETEPLDPEMVMEAEAYMAQHFGGNDLRHPFMSALSRYCVHRKARALQDTRTSAGSTVPETAHGR